MNGKLDAKKVVFTNKNKVEVKTFRLTEPREGEVLIKTVSTLISAGTEIAILTGNHIGFTDKTIGYPPYPFYPFEPGYCNSGNVLAIGDGVDNVSVGDRVYSQTLHSSHVISPANSWAIQKIPNDVSYDQATLTFLGMIALIGVRLANIALGESVLIIGQGIVGQLSLQLSKLSGAGLTIAVDLYKKRIDISKDYGADYVLDPNEVNIYQAVMEITKQKGVNVVIEATGNPKVFQIMFKLAGRLGRIIALGSPRGKTELNLYTELHKKGLSLIGAHGSVLPMEKSPNYPWSQGESKNYILNLLSKGSLKVDKLVTHKVGFEKAPNAYKMLRESPEDVMGVILDWTKA